MKIIYQISYNKNRLPMLRMKDCTVGYPIFAHPSVRWTPTCLFLSLWTASSSMKTNCVAGRRNSESWQRIGQPYVQVREMFCCRRRHWNGQMRSLSCWTGRSPKWGRHTSRCPVKEGRQQTISRQWSITKRGLPTWKHELCMV